MRYAIKAADGSYFKEVVALDDVYDEMNSSHCLEEADLFERLCYIEDFWDYDGKFSKKQGAKIIEVHVTEGPVVNVEGTK